MLTPLAQLPLFLPLPFFLASSFLVPDSNVCTTTKNNNAYNADTTSDAIQASTWWAEFNLVHKLVETHGGSWYSFLQFLSKGEPLLCLNKLNKSTSALRTQQTTTPILDNVMCRNLSSRLVHQSSALIKLLLQWFHLGFQLNVSLLELWLCASLLCCTSSCWLHPRRQSTHFIMNRPGKSCVFACISAMNATRFSCRGDSLLINFCHHLPGFCIAFVGFRDNHRMILSLAMVQAQHYWSYMHNQQHTHTHLHLQINMQALTDKIGSILSGFRGGTSWWNNPPGWSFSMRLHWCPPSILGTFAAGLKNSDFPSHCLYSSLDMSPMLGSGFIRAPDGFQAGGFEAGAASVAFNCQLTVHTIKREPFNKQWRNPTNN